jgi:hypothetical protein
MVTIEIILPMWETIISIRKLISSNAMEGNLILESQQKFLLEDKVKMLLFRETTI